jgi:CheY-like chemotaxis protein
MLLSVRATPAASNIRAASRTVNVWFSLRSEGCGTFPNRRTKNIHFSIFTHLIPSFSVMAATVPATRFTPIVFVTGQPKEEYRQCALELGAVDYIEKPFEVSDFILRIATQLRSHRPNEAPPAPN